MNQIIELLRKYVGLLGSRTAWSVVGLALFTGVDSVKEQIPANWQPYAIPVLTILALHYRANPKAAI